MDGMFGRAKPQAIAFAKMLERKKPPRGKNQKVLFAELKEMAVKTVMDATNGHYFTATMSLLLMQGIGVGLGVISEKELTEINSIRM